MSEIFLSDFHGENDRDTFALALEFMKNNPGTTLTVEPGVYNITTPLARLTMENTISGKYGANPEPTMFSPHFEYDRGLDFKGHKNSRVSAYGVTLLIDGFMEPMSLRECENVEILGLTVDHKRKPYSKGIISDWTELENGHLHFRATFAEGGEICPGLIYPRYTIYSHKTQRFNPLYIEKYEYIDEHHAEFEVSGLNTNEDMSGEELYLWHSYHSRPAILIENAKDTVLRDVTVHSQPGMGIVGMRSENILIERLRVVPSAGEHMSTNTDATHFASCRGKLRLDGCYFEGQGDDSINVHTYYYTVTEREGCRVRLQVKAPTGTHSQALDYPEVGDTLELTSKATLLCEDKYRVVSCTPDFDGYFCDVVLDRELPEDISPYFFSDPDELPDLEFVNCFARNHYARSILIKCRRALVENCTICDCYESAVRIAAEAWWHEGIPTADVTVRRCRFINCGRIDRSCGGVYVRMDCDDRNSLAHESVVIEDNIIDSPFTDHGIILCNVKRALCRRNSVVCRRESVYAGDGVELIGE